MRYNPCEYCIQKRLFRWFFFPYMYSDQLHEATFEEICPLIAHKHIVLKHHRVNVLESCARFQGSDTLHYISYRDIRWLPISIEEPESVLVLRPFYIHQVEQSELFSLLPEDNEVTACPRYDTANHCLASSVGIQYIVTPLSVYLIKLRPSHQHIITVLSEQRGLDGWICNESIVS